MIRIIPTAAGSLAVLALAGCMAHPEPIVDLKGLDPEIFQRDLEECRVYADQVSTGQAAVKGAAVGAVIGAATGAISGDAAEGAGYGGIYGAAESGLGAEGERHVVFARCLEGRGYRVLNYNASNVPATPGTPVPVGRRGVF
jgi:hypothetical protein